MNLEKWKVLMDSFNLSSNADTYRALANAYSEPHRHYHTNLHIDSCLNHLEEVRNLAEYPNEIALALWFHDAIYSPYSKENELKSASWVEEFLGKNSVAADRSARIQGLIMITRHDRPTASMDESLIVDIDLTILGSSAADYAAFEKAIREEYKNIPSFIYWRKRKKILSDFVAKERIYQNQCFYDILEKQARENLSSVLAPAQSGV